MTKKIWQGQAGLDAMLVPIADLMEDPANARFHPDANIDAIARSLAGFKQTKNIVVHRFDGKDVDTVIAGNGTLRAATALGWTHIAATRFDGTDDEARAYAIADNRTTDLSRFDDEILGEQLKRLRETFDGIEMTGFDAEDIARIADGFTDVDPDALPENDPPEDNYVSQYGVIVICADEAEQTTVYEKLRDEGYNAKVVTT